MKTLPLLVLPCLFLMLTSLTAQADTLQRISGGPVQVEVVASGMTTNTTSALSGPLPNGDKTFYGEVVCSSGACTQTQEIRGTNSLTAINGTLICTITLNGTPRDQAACPTVQAAFPRYYVTTTNTTGTAATGGIYVNY